MAACVFVYYFIILCCTKWKRTKSTDLTDETSAKHKGINVYTRICSVQCESIKLALSKNDKVAMAMVVMVANVHYFTQFVLYGGRSVGMPTDGSRTRARSIKYA